MSNILKGILKESNSVYGHSDPAREYGAEDPTYRKRGPYSHTDDDDDGNPFAEYERQQRMFAVGRAQKAAKEKAQRDADHDRLATGTNESLDDPWGDQGNFAGDKPVNLGGVSIKNIQTGDTVKYLGQPSKVVAMSKDRKYSRITISKGMGTVTQDVLTSDLQQLGRGIEEAKSFLQMGDVTDKIKAAINAATQLNGKVVKTAGGYFKVTTLDDPRPAIIAKPEYYDNLKKYQDQLKVINAAIRDIEMQFESNRREIFTDLRELFPNSPTPLKGGSPASKWLSNALANLRHTYYETNRFKTLINQKKTLEDQLKVLRDTGDRHQEQTLEENDNIQTRMRMNDYYDLADAIQEKLRHAIQSGNKELAQKLNKERDELDARVKQYGLMPESEQLDEISNEKLSQYKTAAAADASKADSEGDYKRGDKRFSGIVKATKKQFANDTKKSGIGKGINEFSPGATGPKGPKDYGQPNSSRYIGGNKFVVGTTNNYVLTATIDKWGLEWDEDDEIWFLDSPGAAHIADASEGEIELPPPREQRNQIHDLVTDYLNARNSADLQKVAAYYGHSDDGEMATNEEFRPTPGQATNIRKQTAQKMNPAGTKFVWKRPNQIGGSHTEQELLSMGFRKSTKHNVWGGTQDMWNRLSNNLDENLGDQLKSTSLDALVQAKLAIEKQREADIEAWRQDFEKNTVQKAQQGLRKEFQPTPVAHPGEKHSVLKARLAQLNSAIEKQALLDKLIDKLERKGLMTPSMQNDTDTRMHVRYGAKDNYQSLNQKLDNAIATLQNRLYIRKKSGLKEAQEIKFILVIDGKDKFKFPTREEALKVLNDYKAAFPKSNAKIETRAVAKTMYDEDQDLDENLHKWFKEKWVRFGPDGKIRGDCARGDDSEGKPKCLPQSKAHSLGKKGRASAASRKRREDPNPERSGKAINVNTKKETNEEQLDELKCWSGYTRVQGVPAGAPGSCKKKTNESEHNETCPHCGGEMVSEELMNEKKDACYYKVKSRYKVWPSAYASGALVKCRKKGADSWGNGDKKLKEFAPDNRDSGGGDEEDTLRKYAKMWYNGNVDTQQQVEQILDRMGWEIGELESEEGGAFVIQAGDENGDSYIGFTADDLTNNLEEKWTKKYKDSINCSNPKGFSQKAHCAGKQKNESSILEGIKKV